MDEVKLTDEMFGQMKTAELLVRGFGYMLLFEFIIAASFTISYSYFSL